MNPLTLTVVRCEPIDNHLQRIVFTGEGLARIPDDFYGRHIKLLFKLDDQEKLTLPNLENGKVIWPKPHLKPIARTYSIYQYDRASNELTVDFVLHEAHGVASSFALNAKPGDIVGFSGPGRVDLVQRQKNQFLMVADLSALPAIAALAESLPEQDTAAIFLELENPDIAPSLLAHYFPTRARDVRITRQQFDPEQTLLEPVTEYLQQTNLNDVSITLAGEHASVVCLRQALRELGIDKPQMYATPYWRHLMDEETYHAERHQIMDN